MDVAPYLSGQLLLSMPGMADPRFERVAIAMCVHDAESALGLIINKVRDDIDVRSLLEQLDVDPGIAPAVPVFAGGPVEPGRGFVLHSPEYEGQSTLSVGGRWALTATLDILRDIAAGKGPKRWLIALGYLMLGAQVGLRFTPEMIRIGARALPMLALAVVALLLLCGATGALLSVVAGVDLMSAMLATVPGSIDSIALIALSTGSDISFIMTLQTVRLFAVVLLGPPLARWILHLAQRMSRPDTG